MTALAGLPRMEIPRRDIDVRFLDRFIVGRFEIVASGIDTDRPS